MLPGIESKGGRKNPQVSPLQLNGSWGGGEGNLCYLRNCLATLHKQTKQKSLCQLIVVATLNYNTPNFPLFPHNKSSKFCFCFKENNFKHFIVVAIIKVVGEVSRHLPSTQGILSNVQYKIQRT